MAYAKKKKKKRHIGLIILLSLVGVLIMLAAMFYYAGAMHYTTHFPQGTYINDINVGNMTVEEAKAAVGTDVDEYVLTVYERGGTTETLTAEQLGISYNDTGEIDALIEQFQPYEWIQNNFSTRSFTVETTDVVLDQAAAQSAILKLNCFNSDYVQQPQDAVLIEDGVNTYIQPEIEGNALDQPAAVNVILTAVTNFQPTVDLEAEGLYLAPTVYSDDPALNQKVQQMSTYLNACITFDFGDDRVYTLDGDTIEDWVTNNDDGTFDVDRDKVIEWVKTELAYKTDTFGLTHVFTTSTGQTVTLTGGDYGWCIAREDTADKIIEAIKNGEVTTMEPEYQYKAAFRGIDDIGDTYVEVSIELQHVWCYKDGELVVEGDCVTGNPNRGNGTPSNGVWAIDAKKSPATLGTLDTMGYSSSVNYWMPFNNNVGLHDADGWRSSYGGSIYLTNGSHGCVNLPMSVVSKIYDAVEIGNAVVVWG